MILKLIAWLLIAFGSIFTSYGAFVLITFTDWPAIILGFIFLGPIPLLTGIMILKYLKSHIDLTLAKKLKNTGR